MLHWIDPAARGGGRVRRSASALGDAISICSDAAGGLWTSRRPLENGPEQLSARSAAVETFSSPQVVPQQAVIMIMLEILGADVDDRTRTNISKPR
eukprot:2951065-Rhodomonas_salina.1